MAKKTSVTHAPYTSTGHMQHWPQEELIWDESKRNPATGLLARTPIDWRPNVPFKAVMTLAPGVTSGRSAKYVEWRDTDGHQFPMFVADLVALVVAGTVEKGKVDAWWMAAKRGQNYGIRLATAAEIAEAQPAGEA